ncbi:MAG: hypothetical protein DRI65_05605 [Chloroflexota bacterium]|nr:MAG: hypothetical protein DRI65_05605 [Chloroflexota bacterium]
MQSTRTKILAYLNTHPRSSAAEIGRFLQLTAANIRYHLAILVEGGLVQVSDHRPAGGSGRPILLYNLTSQNLGENLQLLMGATLEALGDLDEYDLFLDKITKLLLKDFHPEPGNLIASFNQAVVYLNEHHYRASWKATPEGPQIELRHCPYCEVAKTHPQLCQLDEQLVSRIFDAKLLLTQKREFGTDPFSPCIFKPPQHDGEKEFNQ